MPQYLLLIYSDQQQTNERWQQMSEDEQQQNLNELAGVHEAAGRGRAVARRPHRERQRTGGAPGGFYTASYRRSRGSPRRLLPLARRRLRRTCSGVGRRASSAAATRPTCSPSGVVYGPDRPGRAWEQGISRRRERRDHLARARRRLRPTRSELAAALEGTRDGLGRLPGSAARTTPAGSTAARYTGLVAEATRRRTPRRAARAELRRHRAPRGGHLAAGSASLSGGDRAGADRGDPARVAVRPIARVPPPVSR